MTPTREDVGFISGSDRCAAWLYSPPDRPSTEANALRPVVVLGPGLGAVKEMRLDAFAERFVDAGYTALVFDHRHLGTSEGEPRQVIDIAEQRADWHAAIALVRSIPGIDPDRVAIFGTSFGGGHVLAVAAADRRVAAVISQCPFTDGRASARTLGLGPTLRVTACAVRDAAAALTRRPRVMVALTGHPGETALMNAPDVVDGYRGIVPHDAEVPGVVAAKIGLQIPFDRPGRFARSIAAPVLFGVCDDDSVAPPGPTLAYAAQAPRSTIKRYPIGHFEIYRGDAFETAIADYVDFLDEHVGV